MGYSGSSMADLNGFNLASSNVMPVNNFEEKKDNNTTFQPSYSENEFMKPGSVKISSVYESDQNAAPFAQSNKQDIIPKKEIEAADNRVPVSKPVTSAPVKNTDSVLGKNTGFGVVGEKDTAVISRKTSESTRYKDLMSAETKEYDEKRQKDMKRMQPLPVWRWMLTIIGLSIPGLNVLLVLIWAIFKTNRARQNMCRAIIFVTMIVGAAVCAVFYIVGISEVTSFIKGFLEDNNINDYILNVVNKIG